MRLDQFLTSVLGVSRKDAKIILKQKKVLVNQKLETNPSLQIDETKDEVIYNNQILKYQEHIYLILNKIHSSKKRTTILTEAVFGNIPPNSV